MRRRQFLAAAGGLAGAALFGPFAGFAQGFPARPIKLVVPVAAGGGTDIVGRLLADKMSTTLPGRIVVENRTGSGVVVGTEAVAKSPPDGYTLLITTFSHAVGPALYSRLPFDTEHDFIAIAYVAKTPLVLVVNPDKIKARTAQDFFAEARARPGMLNYGSAGIGSTPHVAAALMVSQAKLQAIHVPYRGSAPALTDLLAGNIDFMTDLISSSKPHIDTGKLIPLAVTTAERTSILPDVPPLGECGLDGYDASTWNVLLAPAGTPADIVALLNRAANAALEVPALQASMQELGIIAVKGSTPASTAAFIKAEMDKWLPLVRSFGIAPI